MPPRCNPNVKYLYCNLLLGTGVELRLNLELKITN